MAAPVIVISGPVGAGKTTVAGLLARRFDKSAHIRLDDFMTFVVNGWSDPWLPEAGEQNDTVGAAVASAVLRFASGDYTVMLDGHFFPAGIQEMARIYAGSSVAMHYAVLWADLETCMGRAAQRGRDGENFRFDEQSVAQLHERFRGDDVAGANVIDATGTPEEVCEAVLAAFRAGRLAVAA